MSEMLLFKEMGRLDSKELLVCVACKEKEDRLEQLDYRGLLDLLDHLGTKVPFVDRQ